MVLRPGFGGLPAQMVIGCFAEKWLGRRGGGGREGGAGGVGWPLQRLFLDGMGGGFFLEAPLFGTPIIYNMLN